MLPRQAEKYLSTRGAKGDWRPVLPAGEGYRCAIVIPSLAESRNLPATLRSLAANPSHLLEKLLVLVVVNNRCNACEADCLDNQETLRLLPEWTAAFPALRLAWVDAASPELALPDKGGGVGLARKIGHDQVLPLLDWSSDPFIISLDADTLVQPDYLPALVEHFRNSPCGGAVIPFRHRKGDSAEEQAAIQRYELFLRCYLLGLELAGSPYAFHTVGSAMACRASAYVSAGGMNSRVAGEDFYFLQQLKRTSGISRVAGTLIHPSARVSHRVPFGTGRSVGRLVAGEPGVVAFYRHESFLALRAWLELISGRLADEGDSILAAAAHIAPGLEVYLEGQGFSQAWARLRRNHPNPAALLNAFHGWFDALATMKFIHHLSAGPYPRCEPLEAAPQLMKLSGLEPEGDIPGMLEQLRGVQGAGISNLS